MSDAPAATLTDTASSGERTAQAVTIAKPLDTMLAVPAGADRDTLLAAMKGHVLGKAELVGTYAQSVALFK